jgi:hypothetical protein
MCDHNWDGTMKIDSALRIHIATAFASLNNQAAVHSFPPPTSLSQKLNSAIPLGSTGLTTANVAPATAMMFTTAAVDIWMRAVHSFLISASLTEVSPLWASVAGYYSSHYAVRALAHLLGFFQLFLRKRIVRLELQGGHYVCSFNPKKAGEREHRVYWQIVKDDQHFSADPFFTAYNPTIDESDVAHRDRANYADHMAQFPVFRPLNAEAVTTRIHRISEIEFTSPPIPRVSKCPDLESVQIIAYHRLVRFRDFVDAIVGNKNRFWNVHRNPTWARDFMDFQLTEEPTLRSQFTL